MFEFLRLPTQLLTLAACCVLHLPNAAAEIKPGVHIENDRFTGKTSVIFSEGISLSEPTLLITATAPKSDTLIQFEFVSMNGWRFLKCDSFHFLVDSKPKDLGKAKWSRDALRGSSVVERATFILQPNSLYLLSKATKIEYKVCNDEYTFTPVQMNGLKEFTKTLTTPGTFPPNK